MLRERSATLVVSLAVVAGAATVASVRTAHGQASLEATAVAADDLNLDSPLGATADILTSLLERSQEELFKFLETVELLNAESEIDRLVGDPRALNDATAYKLSLLPFHIRYPIYKQIVRQMTRQDELRSRRIYNSTPDNAGLIVLRIETMSDENVEAEVRSSILRHFTARELIDLGFFIAAQQPFFPETEEGWHELRRNLAHRAVALAGSALMVGFAFDVGALSQSGKITRFFDGRVQLGWYAGVRRLGFRFRPQLRAGFTATFPKLQLSLGLSERLRPRNTDPDRAIELAVREGWLNQLVTPQGWDMFFEAAFRRYTDAEGRYRGDRTAGRGGFYWKRDFVRFMPDIVLRGSAEIDWRHTLPTQHAISLGLDHTRASLSLVLQASRTRLPDAHVRTADTRGGAFLAGSIDPRTHMFVQLMKANARLTGDEWETIRGLDERRSQTEAELALLGTPRLSSAQAREAVSRLDRVIAERERAAQRLSRCVADYLESRRRAYTLARWPAADGNIHGPLDYTVLNGAKDEVFGRLHDVSRSLERTPEALRRIRDRVSLLAATIEDLERRPADSSELERPRAQMLTLMRAWRQASMQADQRLASYDLYRESARRILTAERQGRITYEPDFVNPRTVRSILALRSVPLP